MAIVLDTTTIAVARNATGPTTTTASNTLTSGSVILACVNSDADTGNTQTCTISNSGTALTWTKAVDRNALSGGAGYGAFAGIFWAIGDGAAHTITATMAFSKPVAMKCILASGCDTATPIGATGSSDTSSSNTTVAPYTSTINNSQGVATAMDWNNGSTATSSDSNAAYQVNGSLDGITIWKAALTATSGTSVSFNIQMVTTPNWNAVSVELRPLVVAGFVRPTIVVPQVAAQRASRW
jgi:hypothetical protein